MPNHADGPKSGHMGFGYEEHRASGVPFRRERSAQELNAELRAKQNEKKNFAEELQRLKQDLPDIEARAEKMVRLGWLPEDILHQLRQEARERKYRREALERSKKQ